MVNEGHALAKLHNCLRKSHDINELLVRSVPPLHAETCAPVKYPRLMLVTLVLFCCCLPFRCGELENPGFETLR